MKMILITLSILMLPQAAMAKSEFSCREKYTAVSCNEIADAKRSHLCVKYPERLTEVKKDKWCKKVKKKFRRNKKLSMN